VWARGVLWTCDYIVLLCIICVVIDFWVDCHRMSLPLCELLYQSRDLEDLERPRLIEMIRNGQLLLRLLSRIGS